VREDVHQTWTPRRRSRPLGPRWCTLGGLAAEGATQILLRKFPPARFRRPNIPPAVYFRGTPFRARPASRAIIYLSIRRVASSLSLLASEPGRRRPRAGLLHPGR
jgi:hypothetical protein